MIRFIAAIDSKRGLATDKGIPWNLPSDVRYFREKTLGYPVLMGYNTYLQFKQPLPERRNLVASSKKEALREGFELVDNAREFLQKAKEDIWVIGGGGLFSSTLDLADELYLTQIDSDFNCTVFFPEFEDKFELVSESELHTENDLNFKFCIYKKKTS